MLPQICDLHKRCWPAEHDEEEDVSLGGFLDRATFLHDTDAVTWFLLWQQAGLTRCVLRKGWLAAHHRSTLLVH